MTPSSRPQSHETPPGLVSSYPRLGCLMALLIGHGVVLVLGLVKVFEILFG